MAGVDREGRRCCTCLIEIKTRILGEPPAAGACQQQRDGDAVLGHRTMANGVESGKFKFRPADVLFDKLLAQLRANVFQSRTHTTLRDTLLHKLLSGEIRVAEVARETAVVV